MKPESQTVVDQRVLDTMKEEIQAVMRAKFSMKLGQNPQIFQSSDYAANTASSKASSSSVNRSYSKLNFHNREIRLFVLQPSTAPSHVEGSFRSIDLALSPPYIAVSYTWGDQKNMRSVQISHDDSMAVRENLWHFLYVQASTITEPTPFWIDAICINQEDIHERNHQVGLMKHIYRTASSVFIWLGVHFADSELAMDFLKKQSSKRLRQRGYGYHPIWPLRIGQALYALFERQYWRRVWIVQELLFARHIKIWCGGNQCDWADFEALYVKLKTMDELTWLAHHRLHTEVMQSSATVMLWQRAHFRHLHTRFPSLKTLVKTFRDWKCTDLRDKVYALAGLAATDHQAAPDHTLTSKEAYFVAMEMIGVAPADSPVIPDYTLTPKEVYFMVMDKVCDADNSFAAILLEVLGLNERDVQSMERSLVEYKVMVPERLQINSQKPEMLDEH